MSYPIKQVGPSPGMCMRILAITFLTLIHTSTMTQCETNTNTDYPEDYGPKLKDGDEFDFIVVGAGSAGAVVANRLSENPDWNVLLLEAGGYPAPNTEIPALFLTLEATDQNWAYETEPDPNIFLGMANQRGLWPRGRMLGGSSSINAMLYTPGNKRDYDTWEQNGNTNWDWDSIQKYFRKSFNDGSNEFLKTTQYKSQSNMRNVILDSAKEFGQSINDDTILGYHELPVTIQNGKRCSTAKAFLSSIKFRPNLYVATNAQVANVLVDPTTKIAKGVKVRINNAEIDLTASKETILSAGSINSPQILMLSGIGPKKHLENLGIAVVQDLSVGLNLQDHVVTFALLVKFKELIETPIDPDEALAEYVSTQSGILSNVDVTNIVAFLNTKNDSIYPNLQLHHLLARKNEPLLGTFIDVFGYNDITKASILSANEESDLLTISGCVLNPKSHGNLTLKSTNPYDKPIINAGYFSDANGEDLDILVDFAHYVQGLLKTEEMQRIGAEMVDIDIPNMKGIEFNTDDYWVNSFRNLASTIYHPTTTCKMGPSSDKEAVVDPRLKVFGVKHLRVIDASIMPAVVSGNTNAGTIMIGEKGADMIKEDWGYTTESGKVIYKGEL